MQGRSKDYGGMPKKASWLLAHRTVQSTSLIFMKLKTESEEGEVFSLLFVKPRKKTKSKRTSSLFDLLLMH